eukprot:scaffold65560_cov37-Phaeocystis_antarctica.AAC.2
MLANGKTKSTESPCGLRVSLHAAHKNQSSWGSDVPGLRITNQKPPPAGSGHTFKNHETHGTRHSPPRNLPTYTAMRP